MSLVCMFWGFFCKNSQCYYYLEMIQAQFLIDQHFIVFDINNWKTYQKTSSPNVKMTLKRIKLIYESSLTQTPVLLFFLNLFSRSLLLMCASLMLNNRLQLPHGITPDVALQRRIRKRSQPTRPV